MSQFLEANAGWLITLVGMIIGFVVSWTRTNDRVANLNERLDKQDHVLDEIKTNGSPSSRTAIMVLNTSMAAQNDRITVQSQRMIELEKIAATLAGMAKDIEWIKREMTRPGHANAT